MTCQLCNRKLTLKELNTPVLGVIGTYECKKCGAVQGDCYKGDSYKIVLPFFVSQDIPMEKTRYFDLMVVGSNGLERRHGWFDPETRKIVQVG